MIERHSTWNRANTSPSSTCGEYTGADMFPLLHLSPLHNYLLALDEMLLYLRPACA